MRDAPFQNSAFFAVAHPGSPAKIVVLVENLGALKDGSVRGTVLNGGWAGTFGEDFVLVDGDKERHPAKVVWHGQSLLRGDCGASIAEIERQLVGKGVAILPVEKPVSMGDGAGDILF